MRVLPDRLTVESLALKLVQKFIDTPPGGGDFKVGSISMGGVSVSIERINGCLYIRPPDGPLYEDAGEKAMAAATLLMAAAIAASVVKGVFE